MAIAVAVSLALPVAVTRPVENGDDAGGAAQVDTGVRGAGLAAAAEPSRAPAPQPAAAEAATGSPTPTVLTLAQRLVVTLAADGRRQAQVAERWPTPPSMLTGYTWPLPHGRITQPFGPSWAGTLLVQGVPFHDGLDIATFCGDHVVAAHDGVVIAAGRKVDAWMGWVGSLAPSVARRDKHGLWGSLPIIVVVDDGNGYRSIYAHFNAIDVKVGQRVHAGQFIGWEGSTGFATGCHLHYGLFSPFEDALFALEPKVAARTKLPAFEIARIDPLLVLPPRERLRPAAEPASSTPAAVHTGY
jgi:murein DD-endopeptidase MepM/ murein hydrolase activator NlpD